VFVLIFFSEPELADLYPGRVLARGLLAFILPCFVLKRSLYLPPPSRSSPLSVLLPWFNNLPAGRSTSYRHAPSSLALALAPAPPAPPHFSCPSDGNNGNERLRFLTTSSGGTAVGTHFQRKGDEAT